MRRSSGVRSLSLTAFAGCLVAAFAPLFPVWSSGSPHGDREYVHWSTAAEVFLLLALFVAAVFALCSFLVRRIRLTAVSVLPMIPVLAAAVHDNADGFPSGYRVEAGTWLLLVGTVTVLVSGLAALVVRPPATSLTKE